MTVGSLELERLVTVSIVSHHQGEMTLNLIQNLERHCADCIAKVILTKNIPGNVIAWPDKFRFPVEILENSVPKGFGANHNQAFQQCETSWFLVINPDVEINNNVLERLLKSASEPDGLIAPQEVNSFGAPTRNLRGAVTPTEIVRRWFAGYKPPESIPNGWVSGMFMLCRSDAYRSIGGFDQRYFMYCEDFDLCARLMLNGWRVSLDKSTTVQHEPQKSSHKLAAPLIWHVTSLMKMWLSATFWRYIFLRARLR